MLPAAAQNVNAKPEERRSSDLRAPLPDSWAGPPQRHAAAAGPPLEFLDEETGFYTGAALAEFIRYEIDGAAQPDRNELYVTPLCLAAVAVDVPGDPLGDTHRRARDAA